MGLMDRLFGEPHALNADGVRVLDVPSGQNVRELGGYDAGGRTTLAHRFVRSGSTQYLSRRDVDKLRAYGVTHVLDLRGRLESPERTCTLARQRDLVWRNVSLFGNDISDPKLMPPQDTGNYLIGGYLSMLGGHDAVREVFEFFAEAPKESCVLFHCAAGMDRTGMTSMLVLGLAGVSRTQVIKDYLYSFGTPAEVDRAVERGEFSERNPWQNLHARLEAIETVYDRLMEGYGSVEAYLLGCGVTGAQIDAVRAHLLEP